MERLGRVRNLRNSWYHGVDCDEKCLGTKLTLSGLGSIAVGDSWIDGLEKDGKDGKDGKGREEKAKKKGVDKHRQAIISDFCLEVP